LHIRWLTDVGLKPFGDERMELGQRHEPVSYTSRFMRTTGRDAAGLSNREGIHIAAGNQGSIQLSTAAGGCEE
jgi:hypothetical protein